MIRLIASKELQKTLREPRFIAGLLVMLLLTAAAVFLLSNSFERRVEQHEETLRGLEEFTTEFAHPNRIIGILTPPVPPTWSEVYFRGLDDLQDYSSFFLDHILVLFPSLDLIALVSLLASLLAVIFAHDGFSGEREDGTLKMIHTTRASRVSVFFGKALGLWAAVVLPLLSAWILAIVFGTVLGGVAPSGDEWIVLLLVLAGALVYTLFFISLGLTVSASVRHSGASILALLFLWVLFTMVVPNVSPLIGAQLEPLPSVHAMEKEHSRIRNNERDERINRQAADMRISFLRDHGLPDNTSKLSELQTYTDLGWSEERAREAASEYTDRFREIVDRVNDEQKAKTDAMWAVLDRKVDSQQGITRTISLLSPTASFTYYATGLAAQDEMSEEFTQDQISAYQNALWEFVRERWDRASEEAGRPVGVNEFVDISGYPRFQHRQPPLDERLAANLPWLGHLGISVLIVMVLGIWRYGSYDIR